MAAKYGLFLPEKGITSRATVLVDKNGNVAWVKEEDIPQARDNKRILEELRRDQRIVRLRGLPALFGGPGA